MKFVVLEVSSYIPAEVLVKTIYIDGQSVLLLFIFQIYLLYSIYTIKLGIFFYCLEIKFL